jgi:hypothetical protein
VGNGLDSLLLSAVHNSLQLLQARKPLSRFSRVQVPLKHRERMLIELLERATFSSTWSRDSSYIDQCFHKMTCHSFQCLGNVLSLGWDGLLPSLLPMTLCCGDIFTVTMIISPLPRSAKLSLAQDVKPNRKPIHTKRQSYYHLSQRPNADLSLRSYATILVQIDPNLQGCTIKAVLVLTSMPYQIPKILKSNILKINDIETMYPLYTYNPVLCPGRSSLST